MKISFPFFCISAFKFDRIDKILTSRGIKSRNEANKLLKSRKIKINNKIITGRNERFPCNISILLNDEILPSLPPLFLYYKPINVLSSLSDPWGRSNLSHLYIKYSFLKEMHPVVRNSYSFLFLLILSLIVIRVVLIMILQDYYSSQKMGMLQIFFLIRRVELKENMKLL